MTYVQFICIHHESALQFVSSIYYLVGFFQTAKPELFITTKIDILFSIYLFIFLSCQHEKIRNDREILILSDYTIHSTLLHDN